MRVIHVLKPLALKSYDFLINLTIKTFIYSKLLLIEISIF